MKNLKKYIQNERLVRYNKRNNVNNNSRSNLSSKINQPKLKMKNENKI